MIINLYIHLGGYCVMMRDNSGALLRPYGDDCVMKSVWADLLMMGWRYRREFVTTCIASSHDLVVALRQFRRAAGVLLGRVCAGRLVVAW